MTAVTLEKLSTVPGGGSVLRSRLNRLHETLYKRGGIRPVNAAIEELSKIVFLQLHNAQDPDWAPSGYPAIGLLLSPEHVREHGADPVKAAFSEAIRLPQYAARLPGGETQPVWPSDEPFRLERRDVLAEALETLGPEIIRGALESNDFDVLGTAFDALLRGRYDHGGGLATYLTPHNVASGLAEMCLEGLALPSGSEPSHPLFGDPCCGTGRFLIAGLREARTLTEAGGNSLAHAIASGGAVFGADQSSSSVAKARLNLLLYGVPHPSIFAVEDSVVDETLDEWRGRLALILTNPPFGGGKYDDPVGIDRTKRGLPVLGANAKAVDPGLAFFVRCIDLLADGGRLGIVLPDGLVDGKALRAALLQVGAETRTRDISIEANISLPRATFALSGTVAKTSAVVVQKAAARRNWVFFAQAEHVGYLKQGSASVPDPAGDDMPAIARLLRSGLDRDWNGDGAATNTLSKRPSVVAVPRDGLASLDPARVDPAALEARQKVQQAGGVPLRDLLTFVRTRSAKADADRFFISVLHVNELGAVAWRKALHHQPTTPGKVAQPGQVLISLLNPSKLRATVIPEEVGEVICSSEFGVFCSKDPWQAVVLINHPLVRAQISPMGRGTSSSRRRVDPSDLLDVRVPRPSNSSRVHGAQFARALEVLAEGERLAVEALSPDLTDESSPV